MQRFPAPCRGRRLLALTFALVAAPAALAAQNITPAKGEAVEEYGEPTPEEGAEDEKRAGEPPASPDPEGGGTGTKEPEVTPEPPREPPPQGGKGGEIPPKPKPPEPKKGVATALALGAIEVEETDLELEGVGLDIAWVRTYRSRSPFELDTPQGAQWDHAYNVYLEPEGDELILHPGNGRADRFRPKANGNYTHPDYFILGRENLDGSFTFTWPHGGTWNFLPLDGAPAEGRLDTIVDRNGNAIQLNYDGSGRLDDLVDTLNRTIDVVYGPNGRISSVTGSGRTWTYAYFTGAGPNGSAGDLKSVTTPDVTATMGTCSLAPRPLSPANTFDPGKVTSFTYSKGFADERLNHNLLTVTQPSGDLWIANTYSSTIDEDDIDFDRLIAQEPGGSGDQFLYHYVDSSLSPSLPRLQVIVNDRRGVVTHYLHDTYGDLLTTRVFTGFADPALPTTPTTNRPAPAGTPTLFKTRFFYNRAGQLTRLVHPEGNEERFVYETAFTKNPSRLKAGNLRERRSLPGPLGGSQAEIVEQWEYDPVSNFVSVYVDPASGHVFNTYDAAGNLLQRVLPDPLLVHDYTYDSRGRQTSHTWPADGNGHRRVDEYTYGASGYIETSIRDSGVGQLNLTRVFDWTSSGRLACLTDERGNTWEFERNVLDQIVRQTGPVMTALGGVRYEVDSTYDANDNLVQIDVQNRDETGALEPNTHLTTTITYDTGYNEPTLVTREIDVGVTGSTEYLYDASRNLALVRYDGAVNGPHADQVVAQVYDERDLLFQVQRSPGGMTPATDQYEYDGNGLLQTRTTGLEAGGRVTTYAYDGYDRLTRVTDPLGNERLYDYDARSNLTDLDLEGELLDLPGSAANLPLSSATYEYDALSRRTRVTHDWFELAPPQTQILGGASEIVYTWTLSTLGSTTDPAGNVTSYEYDDALRLERITDPLGNVVELTYDGADNVVGRTETHVSDLNPDTFASWTYTYDALNRMTRRDGPAGPPLRYEYDSRGNLRRSLDERSNDTHFEYDGLDRLISRARDITDTGLGGGTLLGTQDTLFGYDYQFGLTTLTDDDGYSTSYTYDDLGRRTMVDYADGTSHTYVYDAHDDVIASTDANGTSIGSGYDELGRLQSQAILPGIGVAGDTMARTFLYDGAGRVVLASDDDATVNRTYDSLGNVVEDEILAPSGGGSVPLTTQAAHDSRGNITDLTYPGGRHIDYTWDGLSRVGLIEEGGLPLCTNAWVGPRQRLELRAYPGGEFSLFTYDVRLRPSAALTVYGADTWVDRTATWLSSGQLAGLDNDLATGSDFAYASDSLGRLSQSDETTPNAAVTTLTYALSDAGDRTVAGYNSAAGDAEVHQYTDTPTDSRLYDENGNLLSRDPAGPPPPGTFVYDGLDRLVRFTSGGSGQVTTYAYDPLGRRIQKIRDATGTPQRTLFAYLGMRVIEETNGAGATRATYVWNLGQEGAELGGQTGEELVTPNGQVVNLVGGERGGLAASAELISMQRSGSDTRLHYDPIGNVAAAVDAATGNLLEWYEYGDFGAPRIYDAANTSIGISAIGNPYVQQSRRYDPETRLLVLTDAMYEPAHARTTSRVDRGDVSIQGANEIFARSSTTGISLPWKDWMGHASPGRAGLNNKYPEIAAPAGIGSSGLDGIQGACMPVRFAGRGTLSLRIEPPKLRGGGASLNNKYPEIAAPAGIGSSGQDGISRLCDGTENPFLYEKPTAASIVLDGPYSVGGGGPTPLGVLWTGGGWGQDFTGRAGAGSSIMMDGPLHLGGCGSVPQIMPDRPAGWPGVTGCDFDIGGGGGGQI